MSVSTTLQGPFYSGISWDISATSKIVIHHLCTRTIHENNIHKLPIKIYKSLNQISPTIMQEFFDLKVTPYSLRNINLLRLLKTNTSRYGTETLCFKGSIIWSTTPNRFENLNSLDKFKQQIKMWKPTTCTCKLCKVY